jgi:voltage-gated potassium channel
MRDYLLKLFAPWRFATDLFIQILILVNVVCFSIETIPDLDTATQGLLDQIELGSMVIFALEYILRTLFAKPFWHYTFSIYGLIDLVALLPLVLTSFIDLRAVRLLRVMRVFRVLKLARYNAALNNFWRALMIAKEEITVFFVFSLVLIYFSAVGIYYFEREAQPVAFSSVFESLWWSVCTLTTVGYGDVYPVTAGGRIFTFLILLIGLSIIAIPTSILSNAMMSVTQKNQLATNLKHKTQSSTEVAGDTPTQPNEKQ